MRGKLASRGSGDAWGPGEQRLRAAVRSHARRRQANVADHDSATSKGTAKDGPTVPRLGPRTDDPKPYDDDWGWWIDFRLGRIEAQCQA